MIPKRRKPEKMGCNKAPQIRNASHLKWIRGHECAVDWHLHIGRTEAAHVRTATDGGTSLKPSDCWTIPLCAMHHAEQHQIGERTFELRYKIPMRSIAEQLWAKSPHRRKTEQ